MMDSCWLKSSVLNRDGARSAIWELNPAEPSWMPLDHERRLSWDSWRRSLGRGMAVERMW